jgi:hypothetical protein
VQAALGLAGLALSVIFGVRFIAWYIANWPRLSGDQADPFVALHELWLAVRWPLLGIGVFLIGWLWALFSSLDIVRAAAKSPPPAAPPPRLV